MEERLVDGATVTRDLFGLADDDDRNFDLDGDVAADAQEVDVEHAALDRMALQLLDDRQLRGVVVDVQVDQGVHTGVGRERLTQVAPVHADGHRIAAKAVNGGGNLALGPQSVAGP